MSELLKVIDEKEESWLDSVIKHAPIIALIFANIGIIIGEVRVYDIVNQITHSPWKAVGAIFSTGAPFMIWELLWQYRIASGIQKLLAILMAVLAFGTAIYLGVQDYLFGVTALPTDAIMKLIVLALGGHVLAFLVYFYIDPKISMKRKKAVMEAKYEEREQQMDVANALLLKAKGVLATKTALEKTYGKREVAAILKQLAGKEVPTEEPTVEKPENGKATKEEVKESVPTHSFR